MFPCLVISRFKGLHAGEHSTQSALLSYKKKQRKRKRKGECVAVCDYLVSSYMLFLISEEYCNLIKKGLLFDQNQLEIEIMNDCKV